MSYRYSVLAVFLFYSAFLCAQPGFGDAHTINDNWSFTLDSSANDMTEARSL